MQHNVCDTNSLPPKKKQIYVVNRYPSQNILVCILNDSDLKE